MKDSGVNAGPGSPALEQAARYRWAAGLVHGRVLDAACGRGWGTTVLSESAATTVGVDFSPPALVDARARHAGRAEFLEADLRALPFEDGRFDCCVCFEAIAHVTDPEAVLDELRRVLKPNGLLLVSAPNSAVYPAGNPLHLNETTPADLEARLADRFANVEMHRQQAYFASLLCPDELLARAGSSTEIEAHTIKLAGGTPGTELHSVALASDGDLPAAPPWLAIGGDPAYAEQERQLANWRERAVRAEAEVLGLKRELGTS